MVVLLCFELGHQIWLEIVLWRSIAIEHRYMLRSRSWYRQLWMLSLYRSLFRQYESNCRVAMIWSVQAVSCRRWRLIDALQLGRKWQNYYPKVQRNKSAIQRLETDWVKTGQLGLKRGSWLKSFACQAYSIDYFFSHVSSSVASTLHFKTCLFFHQESSISSRLEIGRVKQNHMCQDFEVVSVAL